MMPVPFALRRPWMITRDLIQSRAHPDVARLRAIDDPESFVWRILPHAARTFTASITLLPADSARAMAVAYLYCRMLDTYEDLLPDAAERERALAAFAARFGADGIPPAAAPRIARSRARDARDQTHVVLVNRCRLVDQVFVSLQPVVRRHTMDLVRSMAAGMIWSSQAFRAQGGVLIDAAQLSRYCRTVIGLPFLFAVRLHLLRSGGLAVTDALQEDTLQAGEMVQLANVTRDIEKDLRRGIAYHPALAEDLGRSAREPGVGERIRAVREELLQRALRLAPAYERMMLALPFGRVSLARGSGVLMLAFTDRYYRSCAALVGRTAWPGPTSALGIIMRSAAHVVSPALAGRTVRRITAAFLNATAPAG